MKKGGKSPGQVKSKREREQERNRRQYRVSKEGKGYKKTKHKKNCCLIINEDAAIETDKDRIW